MTEGELLVLYYQLILLRLTFLNKGHFHPPGTLEVHLDIEGVPKIEYTF